MCLKHAAALGSNVDLQATEKARTLLGKQRDKNQSPFHDVYCNAYNGKIIECVSSFRTFNHNLVPVKYLPRRNALQKMLKPMNHPLLIHLLVYLLGHL